MARIGLYALLGAALAAAGPLPIARSPAAPDADAAIDSALRVQKAMARADAYLLAGDSGNAVEALEAELPRINGNRKYLARLRDVYRVHITKLYADNQAALARKFLERLCILDPSAASDPGPQKNAAQQQGTRDGRPLAPTAPVAATLAEMAQSSGAPEAKPAPKVRAAMADPFDRANAATPSSLEAAAKGNLAQQLLAQAEAEFRDRHFTDARRFYDQAHRADQSSTSDSRERWAYCKLNYVAEQLNRPDLDAATWADLEREVKTAVELAPRLADTGRWLEGELRNRRGTLDRSGGEAIAVRHLGANSQGWEVAETASFRIYHQQGRILAEKVAQTVERTRTAMYQKWFGRAEAAWNPKCDLYLHATAQDYSRLTGQQSGSPGHASIESEKGTGRIVARRLDMHCDHPNMLDAILPHETTHVVIAELFGGSKVRWADEGMAVLTEPADKVDMHRRNLARGYQDGQLLSVRELMQLSDYPSARQIGAFYAQSVSLVDYLSRQRGPVVFGQFIRDSLREGYEPALRRHYGYSDFADLQARWGQQALAGVSAGETSVAGR